MNKKLLKSTALLALAGATLASAAPAGAVTRDFSKKTKEVTEKLEKIKQEQGGYLVGWRYESKRDKIVRLLDLGRYLINKDEFTEKEYDVAIKKLTESISAYDIYMKNVKITTKLPSYIQSDNVDNQVANLTVAQCYTIIKDLEDALSDFADSILLVQNQNPDLETVPMYFNLNLPYKSILEDNESYYVDFYSNYLYRYGREKNNQIINSYGQSILKLDSLISEVKQILKGKKNAYTEEFKFEAQLILNTKKKKSNITSNFYNALDTEVGIVLTEDIPNIRIAKEKIADLETILHNYYENIGDSTNAAKYEKSIAKNIEEVLEKDKQEQEKRKRDEKTATIVKSGFARPMVVLPEDMYDMSDDIEDGTTEGVVYSLLEQARHDVADAERLGNIDEANTNYNAWLKEKGKEALPKYADTKNKVLDLVAKLQKQYSDISWETIQEDSLNYDRSRITTTVEEKDGQKSVIYGEELQNHNDARLNEIEKVMKELREALSSLNKVTYVARYRAAEAKLKFHGLSTLSGEAGPALFGGSTFGLTGLSGEKQDGLTESNLIDVTFTTSSTRTTTPVSGSLYNAYNPATLSGMMGESAPVSAVEEVTYVSEPVEVTYGSGFVEFEMNSASGESGEVSQPEMVEETTTVVPEVQTVEETIEVEEAPVVEATEDTTSEMNRMTEEQEQALEAEKAARQEALQYDVQVANEAIATFNEINNQLTVYYNQADFSAEVSATLEEARASYSVLDNFLADPENFVAQGVETVSVVADRLTTRASKMADLKAAYDQRAIERAHEAISNFNVANNYVKSPTGAYHNNEDFDYDRYDELYATGRRMTNELDNLLGNGAVTFGDIYYTILGLEDVINMLTALAQA